LFVALVPRVLEFYQTFARRLTNWENHAHQSSHDASLTVKTFALSAIVAYLGLALSAFVYVPFGPFLMNYVHTYITRNQWELSEKKMFATNIHAQQKIDPARESEILLYEGIFIDDISGLQNQMFAYTVTNQVVNTLIEVVLPYVLRGVHNVQNGKHPINGNNNGKKVGFEDNTVDDKEERVFLAEVRRNVALPGYELFGELPWLWPTFSLLTGT